MNRRRFVRTAAGAAAVALSGSWTLNETVAAGLGQRLVDTNVSLSRWPMRRLPLDETVTLVERLRSLGITQAWAGSFDGLLHKNVGAVNAELVRQCRQYGKGLLLPFGTINPTQPDWQEELRRCIESHQIGGIRLFPSYHGYALDEPKLIELLALADAHHLIVQIAASMEDERMQHRLMRVPNPDLNPLPRLLEAFPRVKLVLLNWFRAAKPEIVAELAKFQNIRFDIAMVEGTGGVDALLYKVGAGRVVFGSHAPFYYPESAVLKLQESTLSREQSDGIRFKSAQIWATE